MPKLIEILEFLVLELDFREHQSEEEYLEPEWFTGLRYEPEVLKEVRHIPLLHINSMGCHQTRVQTPEEDAISLAEQGLRFHLVDVKSCNTLIRKYSTAGRINQLQLEKIALKLNLLVENQAPHTRVACMLDKLRQLAQDFLLEDWLVIGILLSKGGATAKAELLFECFSTHNAKMNMIDMKNVVLTKLCHSSLTVLGSLVSHHQSVNSNESKTMKYIEDLRSVEIICVNKVAERMASEGMEISVQTFVSTMSSFRNGAMTSATGWRQFLLEIYNTNPPKKHWTNAYSKLQVTPPSNPQEGV